MAIEFWLINGSTRLRLPVNPPSLKYTSPFGYEEVTVAGLGETSNIGYRGQKEFTIETFWPKKYNPIYCSYSGFISPNTFVSKMESWRNARKPIRFLVTGIGGANCKVTIRDFTIDAEKFGSPGDIYFSLTLKEYREIKIKHVTISSPKKKAKSRPAAVKKSKSKTYTVKKDDCLWKIAKRYYGSGSQWRKIYNANKSKIKDPHWIYPGQKFVIPS
jgi:hypothetical protein